MQILLDAAFCVDALTLTERDLQKSCLLNLYAIDLLVLVHVREISIAFSFYSLTCFYRKYVCMQRQSIIVMCVDLTQFTL